VFGGKISLFQKDDLFRWLAGKKYVDRWQDLKTVCNSDDLDADNKEQARLEKRQK
jgi:hypothetical protein